MFFYQLFYVIGTLVNPSIVQNLNHATLIIDQRFSDKTKVNWWWHNDMGDPFDEMCHGISLVRVQTTLSFDLDMNLTIDFNEAVPKHPATTQKCFAFVSPTSASTHNH